MIARKATYEIAHAATPALTLIRCSQRAYEDTGIPLPAGSCLDPARRLDYTEWATKRSNGLRSSTDFCGRTRQEHRAYERWHRMKHIFSMSHLEIVPDYYLLEAEVEYFHAHSLLVRSTGDDASDLRAQLEDALTSVRGELRARGLDCVVHSAVAHSHSGVEIPGE